MLEHIPAGIVPLLTIGLRSTDDSLSQVCGYITANSDRTFSVDHLQPGEYEVSVGFANEPIMAEGGTTRRVFVGDTNVAGIELSGPPK